MPLPNDPTELHELLGDDSAIKGSRKLAHSDFIRQASRKFRQASLVSHSHQTCQLVGKGWLAGWLECTRVGVVNSGWSSVCGCAACRCIDHAAIVSSNPKHAKHGGITISHCEEVRAGRGGGRCD